MYNTPDRVSVPIRSDRETRPVKRHHSASYFVHRVRDSLTTRVLKLICAIFLSLLFFLGVIAFILWLSLRPHRPRLYIQEFTIPGLDQPAGFENARITFNVTARNSNQHIGIFYDSMEGSVYYKDQRIGSTPLLYPFFQEPKNTTIVYAVLSGASLTVNSNRWMEFTRDRAQGMIAFRLEITSIIRFKVSKWGSKHHRMHANCNAMVGPDGLILASAKDKRCPLYFT